MAKTKDPNANISLGRAFKKCWSTKSYKLWLFIGVIASVVGEVVLIINSQSNGWQSLHQYGTFVLGGLFLAVILVRPCEIAANTTNEQADRDVYIGY